MKSKSPLPDCSNEITKLRNTAANSCRLAKNHDSLRPVVCVCACVSACKEEEVLLFFRQLRRPPTLSVTTRRSKNQKVVIRPSIKILTIGLENFKIPEIYRCNNLAFFEMD